MLSYDPPFVLLSAGVHEADGGMVADTFSTAVTIAQAFAEQVKNPARKYALRALRVLRWASLLV